MYIYNHNTPVSHIKAYKIKRFSEKSISMRSAEKVDTSKIQSAKLIKKTQLTQENRKFLQQLGYKITKNT